MLAGAWQTWKSERNIAKISVITFGDNSTLLKILTSDPCPQPGIPGYNWLNSSWPGILLPQERLASLAGNSYAFLLDQKWNIPEILKFQKYSQPGRVGLLTSQPGRGSIVNIFYSDIRVLYLTFKQKTTHLKDSQWWRRWKRTKKTLLIKIYLFNFSWGLIGLKSPNILCFVPLLDHLQYRSEYEY